MFESYSVTYRWHEYYSQTLEIRSDELRFAHDLENIPTKKHEAAWNNVLTGVPS